MSSLFPDDPIFNQHFVSVAEGAVLFGKYALPAADQLLTEIKRLSALSPFRKMLTPGGKRMSVSMTNCGRLGWISDDRGYRYSERDPVTNRDWPEMPESFRQLAKQASVAAGYFAFDPDCCLINRYEPGSRMSMHQDRDEKDQQAPIVSISLGLNARFLFGGLKREDATRCFLLTHGDVLVWGGPSRLCFHAIQTIKEDILPEGVHEMCRYNLTFRKAG